MSCNNYADHLHVLPEDDANRQIANGFSQHICVRLRSMQVLPVTRGCFKAWNRLIDDHVGHLRKYKCRRLLVLVDFDDDATKYDVKRSQIPADVADRIFVLGVLKEPENLRQQLGKGYEDIGEALAEECLDGRWELWQHDLLRHNLDEARRLAADLRSVLLEPKLR